MVFKTNKSDGSEIITSEIKQCYDSNISTQVIESQELERIVSNTPFLEKDLDISFLHITFLAKLPNIENVTILKQLVFEGEECIVKGNVVYVFYPNGYGRTRFNNNFLERKLKVQATTRNWKTALKIVRLLARD